MTCVAPASGDDDGSTVPPLSSAANQLDGFLGGSTTYAKLLLALSCKAVPMVEWTIGEIVELSGVRTANEHPCKRKVALPAFRPACLLEAKQASDLSHPKHLYLWFLFLSLVILDLHDSPSRLCAYGNAACDAACGLCAYSCRRDVHAALNAAQLGEKSNRMKLAAGFGAMSVNCRDH